MQPSLPGSAKKGTEGGRTEPSGETPRRHIIPTGLTPGKRLNRFKEGSGEFARNQSIIQADLGMFCEILHF